MNRFTVILFLSSVPAWAQTFNPTLQTPNTTNTPDQIVQSCSIQAGLPTPQQRRMGANPARPTPLQNAVYSECLRNSGISSEQLEQLNAPAAPPLSPPSPTQLQQIMGSCAVSVGAANPTYVKTDQKHLFDECLTRNGVKTSTQDVNIH